MDRASSLRVAAELENLSAVRRFVQEKATAFGADPGAVSDVLLAVNEAVTNVIGHGYQGQPGDIQIEVRQRGDALVVCLSDQATLFDPTAVPLPDLSLPLEQRPLGGMGIYIIQQLMDEVTYRVTPQSRNELTMIKKGAIQCS